MLRIARLLGIVIIALSLPVAWWRYRRTERAVLTGIAGVTLIAVLFVPAALPWYYSWPLAVLAPLAQSGRAMAAIAGLSTWIMVIFKPDGSHGMYSWAACRVGDRIRAAGLQLPLPHAGGAGRGGRLGSRLVRHSLGAPHNLSGLVGMQGVDRSCVAQGITRAVAGDGQRRVRVNSQRRISVSR